MRLPETPADGPWLEIQSGRGPGGGNRLLLWRQDGDAALLKLYRRRGSWARERIKAFASPWLEGRLGVTAASRCALERRALGLWRRHGFAVPALLERPLPDGCDASTALWMEWVEGDLLWDRLVDPAAPLAERRGLAARLGREAGERHRVAVDGRESQLVVEHASAKHVIVAAAGLVHFDLETAFHPRLPILDGVAREVSSLLRSLRGPDFEALARAYVGGHPHPALLRDAVRRGMSGGLLSALRRGTDRHRREPGTSKTDMLAWLGDVVR